MEELDEFACKEAWYVLKKLPLNLVSKIPFEVRNTIAEKAEKCDKEMQYIDTTTDLNDMNITDNAKDLLFYLYENYLSDETIKGKIEEYIKFCEKKDN